LASNLEVLPKGLKKQGDNEKSHHQTSSMKLGKSVVVASSCSCCVRARANVKWGDDDDDDDDEDDSGDDDDENDGVSFVLP